MPEAVATTHSALTAGNGMTPRSLRLLDLAPVVTAGATNYPTRSAGGAAVTSCRAAAGADVGLGQDGPDLLSGGPGRRPPGGQRRRRRRLGDRPLPEAVPAALAAAVRTSPEVLQGPAGPDGQDDLIGGSSNLPGTAAEVGRNGFRDGDDTMFGDGAADFVLGDNGTLFRDKPVDGDYPASSSGTRPLGTSHDPGDRPARAPLRRADRRRAAGGTPATTRSTAVRARTTSGARPATTPSAAATATTTCTASSATT